MVKYRTTTGWITLELIIAIGILSISSLLLVSRFRSEQNLIKSHYQRAVIMEIVDGEMEVLAAGEWRNYSSGQHKYQVNYEATANLPSGDFVLTITGKTLKLEWIAHKQGPYVKREVFLP